MRSFRRFDMLVYDGEKRVPRHINVYVNNHEIHELQGIETPVADGDQVAVIPALAGGAGDGVAMTPDEVMRYSRHIIMGPVGPVGQRKLRNAKVLIIGAGGLGSPVAIYLALAGVGTIGLADFDIVDLSNLQRQLLHQTADVGRTKLESGKETLRTYNPHVDVRTHDSPLTSDNAFKVIEDYDIVVNGADNFATRYLVNDACYLLGKTLVDGSILLFDGQATVYRPGQGCYRCLYPGATAAGAGAVVRGGGRARLHDRHHRLDPGDRGVQADPGYRRPAGRQAAARGRALDGVPNDEAAEGPVVPALRRQPDSDGADRLRPVLWHAAARRGGRPARSDARGRLTRQRDRAKSTASPLSGG